MALMVLFFTQCKPTPEGGDENSRKVKVSCTIPINNGDRSDFTNLMETGKVNWSEGYERVYLAVHGETPQIIELVSWAEGTPSNLEFTGEAAEGLIMSGEEYDIWYFGHSQQLETPYFSNDGESLTGSIANQSGRLEDLGYCHIATTKVTAVTENDKVKLNLKGTLANQIAIALLDLENVEELYGDAIVGTEYTLSYNGERYELDVTEDNNAKIEVESESGISYVVLLPNDKNESMIKHKKSDKTYAYTFHGEIKANKIYYRSGLDGTTPEALKWEEIEEPETPTINGHEYVDLGLPSGLLWATCNVGANAPEEYGNYYAWGETTTKTDYSSSTSATYGLSISQLQTQGYIDGEGNLTAQYDAAAANWGGDWRMPTYNELNELRTQCTWTWTTQNGVNGYKVTSKTNGNSIFLPAAGYRHGSSLYGASFGYYWSSTPYGSGSINAYSLYFNGDGHVMDNSNRHHGRSVRPVSGGNNAEPEQPEEPETPNANGHAYVDLGLPSGLKWATCNVGANAPEAYGNYYAWGETSTKSNYSSSNCPTYGLDNSQLQSQGYIDSEGNLTAQYDAAAANWGGDWRMPTKAEQNELLNNCTWTWTTQNGVNGYKVTSKVNRNYIFLPAAGYRSGSSLYGAGVYGGFWSSTPYGSNSGSAYYLDFTSSSLYMYYDYRYEGRSVRPVLE